VILAYNQERGSYKIIDLGTGSTSNAGYASAIYTGSSLGGTAIFSHRSGHTLYFKSLNAGTNIALNSSSTGITISSSGGVSSSIFNTYTGTTAPSTYALKANFNLFTGTTAPATYALKANFNTFTGATAPATYSLKTVFNTYTGTTAPATYKTIASFNVFTGSNNTRISTIENAYVTGATNLGTTGNALFSAKNGKNLEFKKLVAGSNVTLTSSSTGVTIASSGGGSVTTTAGLTGTTTIGINNRGVTYPKLPGVSTQRLLGRGSASSGDTQALTASNGLVITGTSLQLGGIFGTVNLLGISGGNSFKITVNNSSTQQASLAINAGGATLFANNSTGTIQFGKVVADTTSGVEFWAASGTTATKRLTIGQGGKFTFHTSGVFATGNTNTKILSINGSGELEIRTASSLTGGAGSITTTAGLTGTTTLGLGNTAVTPGTYQRATVTVDAKGRLTFASGNTPTYSLSFIGGGTSSITLTGQANAEQFVANNARNQSRYDATYFREVRIVNYVGVASASANNPRLYPQYSTDGSAWVSVGAATIASGDAVSMFTGTATSVQVGNWISIPSAARADVWWRPAQNGGDGSANPAIAMLQLQFR
jgi:hypothetical protein